MLSIFRISRSTATLWLLLAGVLWFYARQPLHHTDLWGHLAYGRWIAEHDALPTTEPFMPLARETSLVDTAWLSQWIGYEVERIGGPTGLQLLQALMVAGCAGLLVWSVSRQTGRFGPAVVALTAFLALEWFQFRIIRPQMAGLGCFLVLGWILDSRPLSWILTGPVLLLFALWANLHGSFVIGLGWLACRALGRMIDAGLAVRSLHAVAQDAEVRRLWGLTAVACGATLLNPYGLRLFAEVLSVAGNPNLRDLIEWAPLSFSTWQGRNFLIVVALIVAARLVTRQPASFVVWLPLCCFGVAAAASARMLVWWAPLAAGCLATQVAALEVKTGGRHRLERQIQSERRSASEPVAVFKRPPGRSWLWSGIAAAGLAAAVGFSPWGRSGRHAAASDLRLIASPQTPVDAVAWLCAHPPRGLMFNPYEWGDYIVWAGPRPVAVFVTSQAHLIAPPIWREYRSIILGRRNCLDLLDRYAVGTILLDPARHHRLAARLAEDARWGAAYSDDVAVVFIRQ